jgi:hypothetical protein
LLLDFFVLQNLFLNFFCMTVDYVSTLMFQLHQRITFGFLLFDDGLELYLFHPRLLL